MNYPEILSKSLTKKNIKTISESMIEMVINGEVEPLEMHSRISFAEKVIKSVKDNPEYQDSILNSAEKYGKIFEKNGCLFQIKESGTKYDFSTCNHPEYQELIKKQEELDRQKKELECFLKSVPASGTTIVNEETGEITKIYPPVKSSKTTVQITIQK